MVNIGREHVVSAHGAAIALNWAYIGIIIIIICVILLLLYVPNATKYFTLTQNQFNCMLNTKDEL